jgi:hypothetical protein
MSQSATLATGLICYALLLSAVLVMRFRNGVGVGFFNRTLVPRQEAPVAFWLEIVPGIIVVLFATVSGFLLLVRSL